MTDLQNTIYAALSSQTNPLFYLENYLELVTDTNGLIWYNPLSSRILKLIELPRPFSIPYDSAIAITTQANTIFGTTSAWWVIILLSGFTHQSEIPHGYMIRYPSLGQMLAIINTKESLAGTVVTI